MGFGTISERGFYLFQSHILLKQTKNQTKKPSMFRSLPLMSGRILTTF